MSGPGPELRASLRGLARQPALTLVAAVTLALGIGGSTAMFSVLKGVLLDPLPYRHPERVMYVWESNPERGYPRFTVSPPNYLDWHASQTALEHLAATEVRSLNLTGDEQPERLQGLAATAEYFQVLGQDPVLGRFFAPGEDRPGAEGVVVLSQGFWRRRFAADPQVIGRRLTLNGESHAVIGVAPDAVRSTFEVYTPLVLAGTTMARDAHYLVVLGRLAAGRTREQAEAEMNRLAAGLAERYPATNAGWGVSLIPAREMLVQGIRQQLMLLLAAVGLVLVIACINVAHLLLARAAARERELALRAALGAGRGRLAALLLGESALLALAGGALGLLVAYWATGALVRLGAAALPRHETIGVDLGVLAFALALSLATGLLAGLAPALTASRPDLQGTLKEGGWSLAGGRRGGLLRQALVLGEVALTLLVLIAAGLVIKSLARLERVELGFEPGSALTLQLSLPAARYPTPEARGAFYRQLLDRVGALPGVEAAGTVLPLPLSGMRLRLPLEVEGRPAPAPDEAPVSHVRWVSPDYHRALGIPLLQGRRFTAADLGAPQVVMVNRTLVRRLWPEGDPVGQRLRMLYPWPGERPWLTVVGVVGDVRHHSLAADEPDMELYLLEPINPMPETTTLVVRAARPPDGLAAEVRREVLALDSNLPTFNVRTLERLVADALGTSRFTGVLFGLFAAVSLVLAVVGVYGTLSYGVSQRTRELGVRIALGAGRGQVLGLVLKRVMLPVGSGLLLGLAGAWGASRWLASLLYDVHPLDPAVFLGLAALLATAALAAAVPPARRATRVDPVEALRHE